jgi:cephalosporin hydroxylase
MSIGPILAYAKRIFGKRPITVLEIGARYGASSKLIINNFIVEKYIIVDPYTGYDDYKIDGFNQIISNDESIYSKVQSDLNSIHHNVIFHRRFSNDIAVLNNIPDKSVDFIFIDGNHTYKYVLQDLENYYPKLTTNGILCGDDFFMRTHENDILKSGAGYDEPMVYEAVIDFCKAHNKTYSVFGEHRSYGKVFMINN